jgi:tetratricopeptide (TPR) repeat protein
MALSEIEKLERRYAENPQGLTFAPLAEVHRKNGDVTRALELLRPGLTLHPDYIPASIVLGRCHLDLGDLPSAETAFTHVLSLDGENVIALKALADIAERQYRFDDSERWLHTLIAVDRSNDEAREQLSRVEASRRQAGVASSASPDVAGGMVGDQAPGATDETLAASETASAAQASSEEVSPLAGSASSSAGAEAPRDPVLGWAGDEGSAAEAAPLELQDLDLARTEESERPAGIEIDQQVTLEEPVEPLSGLVGRHDQDPGPDLHVSSDGWAVETAEDIVLESAGANEFQVANAAEELLSKPIPQQADPLLGERPPLEREEPPAFLAEAPEPSAAGNSSTEPDEAGTESASVAEAAQDQPVAANGGMTAGPADGQAAAPAWAETSWSPPVAETPRQSEADLLVTESMAELLLQQGHTSEAVTVYRHLEARTGNERFRAKVAELESRAAPAAATPAAEPSPAYSVQQTHGQSIQAFLRGVLGARPVPATSAPAPAAPERIAADASATAAPTRPAHDSLSLSSVFGEESTPAPPAVPTAGANAAPGGVSYDEFFGTASSAPARPSRNPDAKSDDLDQFHAWLQNLKR